MEIGYIPPSNIAPPSKYLLKSLLSLFIFFNLIPNNFFPPMASLPNEHLIEIIFDLFISLIKFNIVL